MVHGNYYISIIRSIQSSTTDGSVFKTRNQALDVTHLARVAVDASDDGVAEFAAVAALVEGLHNDGLAAGVAPGQEDDDLARFNAVRPSMLCVWVGWACDILQGSIRATTRTGSRYGEGGEQGRWCTRVGWVRGELRGEGWVRSIKQTGKDVL